MELEMMESGRRLVSKISVLTEYMYIKKLMF